MTGNAGAHYHDGEDPLRRLRRPALGAIGAQSLATLIHDEIIPRLVRAHGHDGDLVTGLPGPSDVDALARRDGPAGLEVAEGDRKLDELEAEAESLAIAIIARRAPLADDLRELVAALKISAIIERIGDYAKNIGKRASAVAQAAPVQPVVIIPEM